MSLWTNLAFVIVETDGRDGRDVLGHLPHEAELLEEVPRRMVLAERHYLTDDPWIHGGLFRVGRFTVIVPPSDHSYWRCGYTDWPEALSKPFARSWLFCTADAAPCVMVFEDGDLVVEVTDFGSKGSAFGLTKVDGERPDEILGAMGQLLGVDDIKHTLRDGTGFMLRAALR